MDRSGMTYADMLLEKPIDPVKNGYNQQPTVHQPMRHLSGRCERPRLISRSNQIRYEHGSHLDED